MGKMTKFIDRNLSLWYNSTILRAQECKGEGLWQNLVIAK